MKEDILGFDEVENKIKGLAEFKFSDFIYADMPTVFDTVQPKKKKKEIIIVKTSNNGRRTSRKDNSLF